MVQVVADFAADLRNHAASELEGAGYKIPVGDDPDRAIYVLMSLRRRWLPQRPRTVIESDALSKAKLSPALREGVDRVRDAIERGADLRPFQSRLVTEEAEYQDLMLNDWGIHHFHLGPFHEGAKSCGRINELLFAWVEEDRALLIDVRDHSSFEEQALLEIINNEWPDVLGRFIVAIGSVDPDPRGRERRALRKAGVSLLTSLSDGKVLRPLGGGSSTDGGSWQASLDADCWLIKVEKMQEAYVANAAQFADALADRTGEFPSELHLELRFAADGGLGVVEKRTGFTLRLD